MKKKLKQIMELSFPFCKNEDDQIALYFQKINSLAHDAEIYLNHRKSDQKPK
jgi:hypothetical protein